MCTVYRMQYMMYITCSNTSLYSCVCVCTTVRESVSVCLYDQCISAKFCVDGSGMLKVGDSSTVVELWGCEILGISM